jgi:hypothetical protein
MLGGGRGPLDATELGLDLLIDGSVAVASRLHRVEHDLRRARRGCRSRGLRRHVRPRANAMLGQPRNTSDSGQRAVGLLSSGRLDSVSNLHGHLRRLHAKRRRLRLLPGELLTVANRLHERVHAGLRGLQ